jgi:hypothetical protein
MTAVGTNYIAVQIQSDIECRLIVEMHSNVQHMTRIFFLFSKFSQRLQLEEKHI